MANNNNKILPGCCIEIVGIGILILGESGIGKSELLLELIDRGHCMVSDDATEIWQHDTQLFAKSPSCIEGLLHIRNIGIVNIKQLYPHALISKTQLQLIVELQPQPAPNNVPHMKTTQKIMGIDLPFVKITTEPQRCTSLLLETLAKSYTLKTPPKTFCEIKTKIDAETKNKTY